MLDEVRTGEKKILDYTNRSILECGVPPGDSFLYSQEAVLEILQNGCMKRGDSVRILGGIGKDHGVGWESVYKKIRTAIDYVFYNTDTETLYKIFGNSISRETGRVSVKTFLNGIAFYAKHQMEAEENGNGTAGI